MTQIGQNMNTTENISFFSFFDNLVAIFCIFGNFHCLDCSADHQKLNIIQKWAFYFLTIWQPFFHISGDFCCLDHLADHQKLNVIQKSAVHFLTICLADHQKLSVIQKWAFHFWKIWWPFFFFFFCISGNFCCLDCSADHQKLNIIQKRAFHFFIFWKFGGLFFFLHFGQLLLLGLLSWSSEVEHNPKMSISFFDNLLSGSSEVESNPKMSISFFENLVAFFFFFCISGNFCCLDCSADHQKLNIIQKQAFHFLTIWQPFFAFWATFVTSIAQLIIRSWT